jgi:3-isopropylmalate/(R)-2-methylmalate dehydratase small subunit
MTNAWIREGAAWVFGDDIGVDGDLMPLSFALGRETDSQVLRHHIFAGIDKSFAGRCRPGDLIVAGRRFGQGNPHIQGFLGLKGAGLSLVAESVPSGSLRNCINAGLATLPNCPGVRVATGDRLRVDYASGVVENLTTGWCASYPPLKPELLAIIAAGGWREHFGRRLAGRHAS